MKSIKLWLDDIRTMPPDFDLHAKNADDAIRLINTNHITHISFDHDLGEEKTGYTVALYIEELAANNKIHKITSDVHSANPVGARRIAVAMKQADIFWKKNIDNQ